MGYTKLGHINLPKSELTDLLGDGSNYYNYPKIKNTTRFNSSSVRRKSCL